MQKSEIAILITFIAIGLLFTAIFYQGPQKTFDDAAYLTYGHQILNHTFNMTVTPYAYGTAFLATIAAGLWLSGGQAWGASLPQIAEYILLIIITFYVLKRYFDRDVAFTIALGAEASGFIMLYSTRVLPDMLLGVLISLVFLLLAYRSKSKWYMFLAGLLTGATIFIKMGGFILLILLAIGELGMVALIGIIVLIFILIVMRNEKRLYYLAGFLFVVMLFQALLPSGLNVISLANRYDQNQVSMSKATLVNNMVLLPLIFIGITPSHYYQASPTAVHDQIYPIGLLGILAIIGILCLRFSKDKRLAGIAIILILSIGYLFFGSEGLAHYSFISPVSRYLIDFLAPLTLLAALPIQMLINTKLGNRYRILILIAVLALIILSNWTVYGLFYHQGQINYIFNPLTTSNTIS